MNTKHYLRLLRTFALATLTAAAVAACSDDTDTDREPLTPPDGNDGIPVTFTANINPGSDANPAATPGTRTVLTPTDRGGFTVKWKGKDSPDGSYDEICIWATKGNVLIGAGGKVYVPTTSAASSELEPQNESNKLTLSSAGEWNFTAIYGSTQPGVGFAGCLLSPRSQSEPNNNEHIADRDFSVATATQTVAAENDEMPRSVNLGFKHKLSALQLHVTNETGAALTVQEIRLSAAGGKIVSSKIYDVAAGNWKADQVYKDDYLQLKITTPAALAPNATPQNFYMLFFPEPEHSGTNMTITVITDRGEFTLTKKAPASPGFEAGKNYMTNIAIKSNPGTGETWSEYVDISTADELKTFHDNVNNGTNYAGKIVRLKNHIILANATWTPIGTGSSKPFRGTFDGGGYLISYLNVDNGNANYAGLFGYVIGGTVRNLRVSGTVTTTGNYAGGIAGTLSGSTVENCIFNGNVQGKDYVGGIVGFNNTNCRIAGCHTEGTVTATSGNAGGIAGANWTSSSIDGCYSEAEVKAGYNTGGIVGSNQSSTVTHCYATGKVSGSSNVGGIAGYTDGGTFTGCIALNPGLTRTSGEAVTFGRIAGINYNNTATFASCGAYNDMTIKDASNATITGGATSVAGDALTADDCLTETTYTNCGFTTDNDWAFDYSSPWTYLPYNKAFRSFPNIYETDYTISADYLNNGTN